jgi:hypothetical protein
MTNEAEACIAVLTGLGRRTKDALVTIGPEGFILLDSGRRS